MLGSMTKTFDKLMDNPEFTLTYTQDLLEAIEKNREKSPEFYEGMVVGISLMAVMIENSAKQVNYWQTLGKMLREQDHGGIEE